MSIEQLVYNLIHALTNLPALQNIDKCSSLPLLAQFETASVSHAPLHDWATLECICTCACWMV